MRVPATPGWVSLSVVVGGPRHSRLRAPCAVPRHSWLGSTGGGGVWPLATPCCGPPAAAVAVCVGWGGGFSWCACLWRGARARGVCAGVCVMCSWWRGCGCVFRVCWCVCVCGCGCVAGAGWGLPLVWVRVWLVCAVVGPSPLLAEVPECEFPPLLAGFRCRWWWVVLATPG